MSEQMLFSAFLTIFIGLSITVIGYLEYTSEGK